MGMLSWIRGTTGTAGNQTPAVSTPEAPVTPRLAQERRIWQKAVLYRQQRHARLTAQAAADARDERARVQGAQDEYEDRMARAMALGSSAFPGDADDDVRAPRITWLPDPGLREYQAELDDVWGARERERYHASQGERG